MMGDAGMATMKTVAKVRDELWDEYEPLWNDYLATKRARIARGETEPDEAEIEARRIALEVRRKISALPKKPREAKQWWPS